VPAAGWVRVPLDSSALQHLAPGAADLHVFAPGGEELPVAVAPAAPRRERRAVEALKVEREKEGWALLLDVGARPIPHERLVFEFSRPGAAPAVRLESSPDGTVWKPLAEGDLFRIGEDEALRRTALSYPATEDRYLRLHWPEAAGFPRVSAVEVETVVGPSLAITLGNAECDTSPGTAICLLTLPAAGQILRRLTLEIEGEGPTGYRLDEARGARWYNLVEGVWQREGGRTRHLLPGRAEPIAGTVLRLELAGLTEAPPRLASYGADLAVQTVLFEAGGPGRYTLAYGGAGRSRRAEPPSAVEAAWLEAGPEREGEIPPLPAGATAPGAPLQDRRRFAASWRVIAPSAQPGDLVRLELPDIVYAAARSDLGDLRLLVGERQIPFSHWSPPEPALAVAEPALQPEPIERGGRESEAEIHLPEPGLPLSELHLTHAAAALRRVVGVRYLEPVRPGTEKRERPAVARRTWACDPEPPLPCRERLPLPGAAPGLLSVRFHDADNPPLGGLAATVWRRRDVLLFAWPADAEGEASVRLLAGSEDLLAPSYDLAALGDTLLGHPWHPAELDLEGTASPEGTPWWSRWVMPATLAIAGLFLVLLLRRILSEH
jgi:hypothetical protein